ncbi:MAG: hypothetical protein II180_13235 [Proteobacteria bacterium]|nr:hypothetical protein [Pseudomonadota bacterium]
MKKLLPILAMLSSCALCACNESQTVEGEDAPNDGKTITVFEDDTSKGSIVIDNMIQFAVTITADGQDQKGIPVSDIIQKVNNLSDAELDAYLSQYICDYESGKDGFRPSSKGERCPMVPCIYTKQSYINITTTDLFYDESAPMKNGCYHVDEVSKVLMYKADAGAPKIWVYLNGAVTGIEVDLTQLTATKVDGKDAVKVSDILAKANIPADLTNYDCDMRTDESEKTFSDAGICNAVQCNGLKEQYVFLESRALSSSDTTSACGNIDHLKAIYVTEQRESYDSYIITINIDGKSYTVDIATLTDKIVTLNAVASIKLTDILAAANIDLGDASQYLCDYASADGFRPANKNSCKEILSCEKLESSYVSLVDAHKMTMEDAPANCYNVTGLATIDIMPATGTQPTDPKPQDPQYSSWNIEIVLDGETKATVDIATLVEKIVDKNGTAVVTIADVLAAAGITENLADLYCNYFGADGWYPGKKDNCKEIRSCQDSSDIALESHKLNIDGAPGCYGVSDLAKIEISTTNPNNT